MVDVPSHSRLSYIAKEERFLLVPGLVPSPPLCQWPKTQVRPISRCAHGSDIHSKGVDNGLVVPEILLILKEILVNLGGYTVEGIFRKAGLESEMENIRAQLRDGKTFVSYNEHTIATMLKVWIPFSEWILSGLLTRTLAMV